MTQLNLSGRESGDTSQKQNSEPSEPKDGSISNQTVGALGALAMFAAVIVIGSCSRSSKPVAVQQPIQTTAPVSSPAATAPASVQPPAVKAKAKTKKRTAAIVSYVNPEYGVSFSFPRQYSLKSGDAAQLSWGDLGPFQMDFVHPGGVTLAGVTLPVNSYPGTDFKSAFVNLSVNPGMTSEACNQFAFPEQKTGSETSSTNASDASPRSDTATTVKIGAVEFSAVENSTAAAKKQTDAKYYHAFSNGACYEFALGLGTESDGNVKRIIPVDRHEVFTKLEKILTTVKLQPAAAPETETAAPSATVPASSVSPMTQSGTSNTQNAISNTQTGESNTPEQSAIDRNF